MEVSVQRVVAEFAKLSKVRFNGVGWLDGTSRSMPMPGTIKQNVHVCRKLKLGLAEEAERDFRPKEVARAENRMHRGVRTERRGKVVVQHPRSGISGALEHSAVFAVRLNDFMKQRHGVDPACKLRELVPNFRGKLVTCVERMRKQIIVIVHVQGDSAPDLLEIAQASGLLCFRFRLGEHGKEERSENRDDRDDYQKLDEGEAPSHYLSLRHNPEQSDAAPIESDLEFIVPSQP